MRSRPEGVLDGTFPEMTPQTKGEKAPAWTARVAILNRRTALPAGLRSPDREARGGWRILPAARVDPEKKKTMPGSFDRGWRMGFDRTVDRGTSSRPSLGGVRLAWSCERRSR
jgi:hypothetical protein